MSIKNEIGSWFTKVNVDCFNLPKSTLKEGQQNKNAFKELPLGARQHGDSKLFDSEEPKSKLSIGWLIFFK